LNVTLTAKSALTAPAHRRRTCPGTHSYLSPFYPNLHLFAIILLFSLPSAIEVPLKLQLH